MKVGDVMTRTVISVRPDGTVADAVGTMLKARISGLPVVDAAGALVGIVTEGDFLRRTETGTERHRPRWLEFLLGPGPLAADYVRTHARKVEEVMTRDVATVAPSTPLEEAVRTMERKQIKRLPVVEGKRVVGILSRANLLRALARVAPEAAREPAGDSEIRRRLDAEIDKQPWAARGLANAIVRNGVVDLWGTVLDEREREALRVAAENIPGVKAVNDHLLWIEPISGTVIAAPEAPSPAPRPARKARPAHTR
ncbi:MAG: CBS domain-containing protein [Rhodospirillaceae bacterium]|nr:CBS domain-containing protein [Rhodospirillaceae bacterium]